jgi:membrane protein YdbS with pleckstrin-like domain
MTLPNQPPLQSTNPAIAGAPATDAAHHRPPDDHEIIYYEGSPQVRSQVGHLLVWAFIGLVLIAAPILYHQLTRQHVWPIWWLTLALIVIGLLCFIIPWIRIHTVRYRISNYRIDYERGLVTKRIDTLELWHVEDIDFKQGLLDRILGVGTIDVMSNDKTTPRLELHGLPKPREIFDALKQRVIAVKRQSGVLKMDIG